MTTDEFDTIATWTAEAVAAFGPSHAVPAGCRGSGSPSALHWLSDRLALGAGSQLLDCGAGVGGPAAWAHRERGADVVLTDPMPGACRAARDLFALPCVQADGRLPFADQSFDSAWCLGVLSVTTKKVELIGELARVLRPGGGLGLLVLVQKAPGLSEQPTGNSFPRPADLIRLLADAGLEVHAQVRTDDLSDPPSDWQDRQQAVTDRLAQDHGHERAWQSSVAQQRLLGRLLGSGQLDTLLVHAVRRDGS